MLHAPWYRLFLYNAENDIAHAYELYVQQVQILQQLWDAREAFDEVVGQNEGWKPVVEFLRAPKRFSGIETFLAKEISLILVRVGTILPHTSNTDWSPIGCGAEKGHRRLMKQELRGIALSNEMMELQLALLLEHLHEHFGDFSCSVGRAARPLQAHDLQNMECEFNKHESIVNKDGGRHRKYTPFEERKKAKGDVAQEQEKDRLLEKIQVGLFTDCICVHCHCNGRLDLHGRSPHTFGYLTHHLLLPPHLPPPLHLLSVPLALLFSCLPPPTCLRIPVLCSWPLSLPLR